VRNVRPLDGQYGQQRIVSERVPIMIRQRGAARRRTLLPAAAAPLSCRQASVASSGKTTRYSNIRRTRRPKAWPCRSKAAWNSMAASYTRSASGPPAQPPSGAIVAPSTPGLRPGLAGSPLARDPKSQTGQHSPVYVCLRPRTVCSMAPPDRPSPRSIGGRCPCSLFSMPGRVMKRKYASPCWRNRFARF